MNKIPFQPHDITSKEELFGRDKLLEKLLTDAALRQNIPVIGSRRYGKTCLIKTAYNLIRSNDNSSVYPVYLDFKSDSIVGTVSSYIYMISKLIEILFKDKIFTDTESFGSINLRPSDDWSEIEEQLIQLSPSRVQNLLEKIIRFFSDYMDKAILFMIDEYEYLFKYALENPMSFSKLRAMSSDINDKGERYFCFWLVGSMPWDTLIASVPGSGEANTVTAPEYVTPIDEESFYMMWEQECKKIEDKELYEYMMQNRDFAFKKSGGVPFYGKDLIGAYLYKYRKQPDFSICNPHFKELSTKAISSGEYRILKDIALLPRKIEPSVHRSNLISKGILKSDAKGKLYIQGEFLQEFILAENNDIKALKPQKSELEQLVRKIMNLIETINNQLKNMKKDYLFKPVNDSSSMENDLRTPCYNKDQFADFASALYKTYFERSKDRCGDIRIGKKYFRDSKFSKCVDMARHSFGGGHEMDNFDRRPGQFSKGDVLLELTGCVNEPYSAEEWYNLQSAFLKRFYSELENMYSDLKQSANRR